MKFLLLNEIVRMTKPEASSTAKTYKLFGCLPIRCKKVKTKKPKTAEELHKERVEYEEKEAFEKKKAALPRYTDCYVAALAGV